MIIDPKYLEQIIAIYDSINFYKEGTTTDEKKHRITAELMELGQDRANKVFEVLDRVRKSHDIKSK